MATMLAIILLSGCRSRSMASNKGSWYPVAWHSRASFWKLTMVKKLDNLARFSPCSNRYLVAGEMHLSFRAWPRADPKKMVINEDLFEIGYFNITIAFQETGKRTELFVRSEHIWLNGRTRTGRVVDSCFGLTTQMPGIWILFIAYHGLCSFIRVLINLGSKFYPWIHGSKKCT